MLKKRKIIEKLDINLFPESTSKEEYNRKKAEYIANYETYESGHSSGFFRYISGRYIKNPAVGEAEWNKAYPGGFTEWRGKMRQLNAYGEQTVIDKVNELVEFFNALSSTKIK